MFNKQCINNLNRSNQIQSNRSNIIQSNRSIKKLEIVNNEKN